jgi:hypothetical protein
MNKFKWTIEIELEEELISTGFDLSNLDIQESILDVIAPFTSDSNKRLTVIKKPTKKEINKAIR